MLDWVLRWPYKKNPSGRHSFYFARVNKFRTQDGEHFKIRDFTVLVHEQIVVVEYQEECYLLGVTRTTSIAKVEKRSSETQLEEKVLD